MPDTLSQQPRLSNTQETTQYLLSMWQHTDDLPPWGTPGRAQKLREYVQLEPILSGAWSSMVSKACSLDWQVIGGRNRVKRYQELLAEMEDGAGWQKGLSKFVQDYITTDPGAFWELAREGSNGPVTGIYNLDAACMGLTGNVEYPVRYAPRLTSGKLNKKGSIPFAPGDFAHAVDMPSADETKFGLGFCAISRCLRASRVLLALYNYDEEKLADMPMPGVVAVTGLTMDELSAAFALYQQHRDSKQQAIFKALLWIASQSSPLQAIDIKLTSFAGLPENFERDQVYSLYIYVLALCFGVDAREFWPATQSGATKGEAEVQAQKAKGKGFGQMLAAIERAINWRILPNGIEFAFDRANEEDDLAREIGRGQAIKNVRALWEPAPGTGVGLISTEEARRMLVEMQAAPDWLAPTDDVTLHSQDRTIEEPSSLPTPMDQEAEKQKLAAEIAKGQANNNAQNGNNNGNGSQNGNGKQPPTSNPSQQQFAQKAMRADLDRGEPLVGMHSNGDVTVLWTSATQHPVLLPALFGSKARQDAAIAHLQAAGLLMTDGVLTEN